MFPQFRGTLQMYFRLAKVDGMQDVIQLFVFETHILHVSGKLFGILGHSQLPFIAQ